MITIILVIHIIVCLTLVTVVLLQQGKGADVGAVFGGSSQTVFGASGAGNILTKITWSCAIVFFATSIILAYSSTRRVTGSIFEGGRIQLNSLPHGNAGASAMPASATAPHPVAPVAPATTK